MILKLDLVRGHEVIVAIANGRISRMGLATAAVGELPSIIPSSKQLIKVLALSGLPQRGDRFPDADYDDYILKQHIVRAFDALNYGIEMIYEFKGTMTVSDSSTLSYVPTQLHPSDFKPLYVKYTPAGGAEIKKLLTLNSPLPMRHLTITKTIDFMASSDVIDAYPSVNQVEWMGLPKGFWLFSGLDGYTDDDGVTYTYTATFTTKQRENWSQLGFMTDDNGQAIAIPEASVATLRATEYAYAQNTTVNGLLLTGQVPLADFFAIFGI